MNFLNLGLLLCCIDIMSWIIKLINKRILYGTLFKFEDVQTVKNRGERIKIAYRIQINRCN